MTTLASLTYQPVVDPNQPVAALNQIGAAAQSMGAQVAAVDQKVGRANASFDALARSLSPTERALQAIERATQRVNERMQQAVEAAQREGVAQDRLNAVLAQGARQKEQAALRAVQGLREEERAAALASAGYQALAAKLTQTSAAAQQVTNSFGLARHQVQNLTAQFVDLGTQLASGGGIFLPLVQQGPQAIDAVGGLGNAMRLAGQVLTPFRVGVAAAVAGLALAVTAAESTDRAIAGLSQRLRATRTDFADAAREIEASARTLAGTSALSTDDARQAGAAIRGARGFAGTQADMERMVRTSADVAKAFGITVPQAAQQMADALNRPGEAARRLAGQDLPAMTDALRRQVELLEASGRRSEASRLVIDALARSTAGAATEMTPFQRSLEEASQATTRLWNVARPLLEEIGRPILDGVARGFHSIADAIGAAAEAAKNFQPSEFLRRLLLGTPIGTQEGESPLATLSRLWGAVAGTGIGTPPAPATSSGAAALAAGSIARDASAAQIMDAVRAEARRQGVDPEFAARVAQRESGGRQYSDPATGAIYSSPRGAQGVMQLMPGTASDLGVNPRDTADNIRGGIMYLAQQLGRYGGDQTLAAAAYNWGPGNVDRYRRAQVGDPNAPRIPAETLAYVAATARSPDGQPGLLTVPGARIAAANEISRGLDGRSVELAKAEARARTYREALEVPNLDPTSARNYREQLERVQAEIIALQAPMDELRRRGDLQARVFRLQEGAARDLAEAEQKGQEAARARGAGPAEQAAQGLEERRQAQARLNDQLNTAIERTERETAVSRDAAAVAMQGAAAVQAMTIQRQAENEALRYAAPGTAEYVAAVTRLVEAKRAQRSAEVDLQTANTLTQQRDQLELLQRESELIGQTTERRQTELAVLREQQRVRNAGGDPNSAASRAAQDNIRLIGQQTEANQQLTNSMQEFGRIGENAFDRVTQAIIDSGGELKDLGKIGKQVGASLLSDFLKLGAYNPFANWAFGGTRATLGGVFTGLFGGGGAGSGTVGGSIPGGINTGVGAISPAMVSLLSGSAPSNDAIRLALSSNGTTSSGGILSQLRGLPNLFDIGGEGGIGSGAFRWIDRQFGTGIAPWLNGNAYAGWTTNAAGEPLMVSNGQVIGGALGVAGGAFGLYNAFRTGGARGWAEGVSGAASVAGGAATLAGGAAAGATGILATTAAVAPYVAIAAAIIARFLPAAKPSNREGNARVDLSTGDVVVGGQTGEKFSESNREAARGMTKAVADFGARLERVYGVDTRGVVQIGVGDRDGLYSRINGQEIGRYESTQEGTAALVRETMSAILRANKDQFTGAPRTALETVGTADAEVALQAVDWVKNVYEPMVEIGKETNEFRSAMAQLDTQFGDVIEQAKLYGLSTEVLTQKLAEAKTKLTESRDKEEADQLRALGNRARSASGQVQTLADVLRDFDEEAKNQTTQMREWAEARDLSGTRLQAVLDALAAALSAERTAAIKAYADAVGQVNQGLEDRLFALSNDTSTLEGALAAYDRQALRERTEFVKQGLGDIALLEKTQAAERAQIVTNFGKQATAALQAFGGSVRQFLDGLKVGEAGGRSPEERYRNAALIFERDLGLARGGDADAQGRLTNSANALLEASSAMYASSEAFVSVRGYIEAALANLPATVSYDQQMVALLTESGQRDLAAKVQLDLIAARAGGEAGAGIVRAAIEAGYGATVAALTSAGQSWLVTAAQQVANDNTIAATQVSWLAALQTSATYQSRLLERVAVATEQDLGGITTVALAAQQTAGAVASLQAALEGGTAGRLQAIYDNISALTAVVGNLRLSVTVNGSRSNPYPPDDIGSGDGSNGSSSGGDSDSAGDNPGYARGGWIGNGTWNRDSVRAAYAGGGDVMLAGGEYVVSAPAAARYADLLPRINAGTYGNDNGALLAELRALRSEVAALRGETAVLRRVAAATEATADAAGATADGVVRLGDQAQGARVRGRMAA